MTVSQPAPDQQADSRSTTQIVGDIGKDLSRLVRQEIDLAKIEAKQEASKAGKGAGMLGGAGVSAHLMLIFLSAALMFLLDIWLHIAWAALIVGGVWALTAGILALLGRKNLKDVNPSLESTQRTLKEDVQWARQLRS